MGVLDTKDASSPGEEITFQQRISSLRNALTPPRLTSDDPRMRGYDLIFTDRTDSTVAEGINDALLDFRILPDDKRKSNTLAQSLERELYPATKTGKYLPDVRDSAAQAGTALIAHELLKYAAWRMGVGQKKGYQELLEWTKLVVLDEQNLVHKILFANCSRLRDWVSVADGLRSMIATMENRGMEHNNALAETLLATRGLVNIRLVLYKAMDRKFSPGNLVSKEIKEIWAKTANLQFVEDYPANALRRIINDINDHPLCLMIKTTPPFMLRGSDDNETLRTIAVSENFPVQPVPTGLGDQLEVKEDLFCNNLFLALQGKNPTIK